MRCFIIFLTTFLSLGLEITYAQTTREVATVAEFNTACAASAPGDTIEITDGSYTNWTDVQVTCAGTSGNPITITCDTQEGCVFTGDNNNFDVRADWIVFDGLRFTNRTTGFGSSFDGLIHFNGAQDGRVTNVGFDNLANSSITAIAVNSINVSTDESNRIEIDNNRFEDNNALFLYVTIREDNAGESFGHSVHDNYFEDNTASVSQPLLRWGSHRDWADFDSDSDIYNNTFIRTVVVEWDLIHHKASGVRYYNNYHEDSSHLTLRQGSGNVISHNYLLRPIDHHAASLGYGGIRITGADHKIYNNVIVGDGTEPGYGMQMEHGCGPFPAHYPDVTGVLIANNTIVNTKDGGIRIGRFAGSGCTGGPARTVAPNNNDIYNNIFDSDTGKHIVDGGAGTNDIDTNLFNGSAGNDLPGSNAINDDPAFVTEFTNLQLQSGSPAIDVGLTVAIVTDDYLGTSRPQNSIYDVGAYEFDSGASPPAAPSGLTATAVGSSQINLTWIDNSADETGFEIDRSTPACTSFSLRTTTAANATSYSDTGLAPNTNYCYRVRAINGSGNSAYTSNAQDTTEAGSSVIRGKRIRGSIR